MVAAIAVICAPPVAAQSPPAAALTERGAQLDTSGFRYQRPISPGDPGLVVMPLDAAVLAHSSGRSAASPTFAWSTRAPPDSVSARAANRAAAWSLEFQPRGPTVRHRARVVEAPLVLRHHAAVREPATTQCRPGDVRPDLPPAGAAWRRAAAGSTPARRLVRPARATVWEHSDAVDARRRRSSSRSGWTFTRAVADRGRRRQPAAADYRGAAAVAGWRLRFFQRRAGRCGCSTGRRRSRRRIRPGAAGAGGDGGRRARSPRRRKRAAGARPRRSSRRAAFWIGLALRGRAAARR